jgi:hypothetical protein
MTAFDSAADRVVRRYRGWTAITAPLLPLKNQVSIIARTQVERILANQDACPAPKPTPVTRTWFGFTLCERRCALKPHRSIVFGMLVTANRRHIPNRILGANPDRIVDAAHKKAPTCAGAFWLSQHVNTKNQKVMLQLSIRPVSALELSVTRSLQLPFNVSVDRFTM